MLSTKKQGPRLPRIKGQVDLFSVPSFFSNTPPLIFSARSFEVALYDRFLLSRGKSEYVNGFERVVFLLFNIGLEVGFIFISLAVAFSFYVSSWKELNWSFELNVLALCWKVKFHEEICFWIRLCSGFGDSGGGWLGF